MQYPGTTLPFGGNDLEQRKRDLVKQMVGGGPSSTLSIGGSRGDAPAASPGLSYNPFFSAYLGALSRQLSGGQQTPFFGAGGARTSIMPNPGANAAIQTGVSAGSAGMGGVGGSPAAAPSGVNPQAIASLFGPNAPTSMGDMNTLGMRHLFGGGGNPLSNPVLFNPAQWFNPGVGINKAG